MNLTSSEYGVVTSDLFEISSLSNDTKRVMREFLKNYTSIQTKRAYYFDLLSFSDYYKLNMHHKRLIDINREDIINYRDYLVSFGGKDGRGVSSKTINRRLACLYALFEYLKKEKILQENPVEFVKRFKISSKVVSSYMDEELVDEYFKIPLNTYKGSDLLERVVCRALFTFGMRVDELSSIRIKNLIVVDGKYSLRYKIKGGKELIKECPKEFISELGLYLDWMEQKGYSLSEEDYLIRGTKKSRGKISNRAINYIIDKMAKKVGAKGNYSSHTGRVNTIYKVDKKHGLYTAKEYVGHSSVSTTEKYREKSPTGVKSLSHSIFD